MIDQWTKSLDEKGQIDVVYTDFEKAFDKVPHRRLIRKLHLYGINTAVINWIESFLCYRRHCVRVNGKLSHWKDVCSGIPQGSVIGPLLFIIFINDLPQDCGDGSDIYMFADDAKLFQFIYDTNDSGILEAACQNIFLWCDKSLMKLNIDKCKVLSLCRGKHKVEYKYGFDVPGRGFVELEHVNQMKDLGVIIDLDLSFKSHVYDKVNKGFQMLGMISRSFGNLDAFCFKMLYISLVRSHLEYAHSVWNPHTVELIQALERVQKRATKLVNCCKKLSYKDRLRYLQLPTLKYRRLRGDMIEVYKIINGLYDNRVVPSLPLNVNSRTRGNTFKLRFERPKYDLRKYSFTVRIVKLWNSLPDSLVKQESLFAFEKGLDNLWKDEELYYDFKADVPGSL